MKHSWHTRALHLLVAAAIVFQLASSQVMRVPRPGRPPLSDLEAGAFALHEYAGLVSMAIIALFWLWLLVRRKGTDLGLLFPWFSRRRLADLREDIIAARPVRGAACPAGARPSGGACLGDPGRRSGAGTRRGDHRHGRLFRLDRRHAHDAGSPALPSTFMARSPMSCGAIWWSMSARLCSTSCWGTGSSTRCHPCDRRHRRRPRAALWRASRTPADCGTDARSGHRRRPCSKRDPRRPVAPLTGRAARRPHL